MLRHSIVLNILLLVAVVALAWASHRRDAPAVDALMPFAETADASDETGDPPAAAPPDQAQVAAHMLDRLQRIDARLAALEAGARGTSPTAQVPMRIDPRSAAEADRRVAQIFSDREVDAQDWVRWQAALSQMPAPEQFALGAAFARAVNRDRLVLSF
jgi:hypothetical protein